MTSKTEVRISNLTYDIVCVVIIIIIIIIILIKFHDIIHLHT